MLKSHAAYADHLKSFTCANAAVEYIQHIYQKSIASIRTHLMDPEALKNDPCSNYPYVGFSVQSEQIHNISTLAYGIAQEPGVYGTTVTRPFLFASYYREQLQLILKHHQVPIVVGQSKRSIPLPFVEDLMISTLQSQEMAGLNYEFALPNLSLVDDEIVDGPTWGTSKLKPLALFTAERVDYSLNRLHHYCGTSVEHFQRFILLTNYQRYVHPFLQYAHQQLNIDTDYTSIVTPGDVVMHPGDPFKEEAINGCALPQMPAYHLKRKDGNGITFLNIGVGPSNAKNITDHLAVLRPHFWLMLGHCAGLRRNQMLGDYALAHGYVRHDHVLDDVIPLWVPIPPIAEVQVALQEAVADITDLQGAELKTRMRTGTIVSTSDRNWELRSKSMSHHLKLSRAIALDMESATIAANGFRFRVPYGTLLCVSDKPLHGELKLRGMANKFYQERVKQHLEIGLRTIEILHTQLLSSLHSRKLRSFQESPFR